MKKEELIKLLDAGNQLEFSSYEHAPEIRENVLDNQGKMPGLDQIEQLDQYDGEDFEYGDLQIVDGDWVYLIKPRPLDYKKADMDVVESILNSDISAYEIEKRTGISRMTITNYRNKKADPEKMTVLNAIKLTRFGKELRKKELEKILSENKNDSVARYEYDILQDELSDLPDYDFED